MLLTLYLYGKCIVLRKVILSVFTLFCFARNLFAQLRMNFQQFVLSRLRTVNVVLHQMVRSLIKLTSLFAGID